MNSFTWVKFEESKSNGNVFKALFIIRVLEPGRLVAKLEYPVYSPVQCELSLYKNSVPTRLNYIPVKEFEHPFEIIVDGGRVVSLKIPTSLSVSYENLLKGLVGMLQVDLSSFKHVDSFPNSYDQETFQGLFKKMETDVTGECETLYSVSPLPAEWRRELLLFAEDPIEITKVKNYGSCEKNVGYNFGVPEGAVWKGTAYDNDEKQFIKRTSESRILAGKQGTIYRSEAVNSVLVNPLLFGKQKAEVYSYVSFYLLSIEPESSEDWKKSVEYRTVESLLFTFNETAFIKGDENIVDAQKLLQEMAPLLLHLNTLPKTDFLSKFNIVVRSITFMNLEQLNQLTSIIEAAKFSKNIAKQTMWKIYRDAVAQAGTIAAFKEIKSWILTKKIEGEEAGEVISSMASVLRFPNKETINNFFDFVMSPEVQEQKDLNTTALLAVTKFISRGDEIFLVEEKVIPRLSLELKQAIEKDDKNKAQVYVRVLGNLADPNILKVFAPYLEGKIPVSKYLRIQMVLSLKTVANTKNEYVRAVLFSLLKNTAEPYEVRVAAALNIFLAFPTQDMLQIMAHMTNVDPSTQVRAVLTNSITFAAELKDPRFAQL